MKIDPFKVLKRPMVTEKSNMLKETSNQVVFEVDQTAKKPVIKYAVEKAFGVSVEDVRTAIVRGKVKTVGRYVGKRSDYKKAYVRLKVGDKIDVFEGV
ncbi:MAG: 50S ribosomal protein L23 [Bdellovibrionales bacterium]|nr:50S ribosomal protein L23 [Bdellovibrionales bacterium]